MVTDLFTSSTYSRDIELFDKLGLKQFHNIANNINKPLYLGRVKQGEAWAKVWVKCAPAQFYDFEVYSPESHKVYKCSTGSGSLSDYWSIIEKMMDDMFVVNTINKK